MEVHHDQLLIPFLIQIWSLEEENKQLLSQISTLQTQLSRAREAAIQTLTPQPHVSSNKATSLDAFIIHMQYDIDQLKINTTARR